MSIANEITRLQNAKADIKSSIENKGVTVPSSAKLDGYSDYIDAIQSGGSAVIQSLTVTDNGTYTAPSGVDGYSPVTVNVSGGGTASKTRKDINFFDYDGTIVESYTASEWANVSALPSNPSHSGLVAQGWNYTKAEVDAEVTAQGKCDVGQMYITESGDTEIDIELQEGRLNPWVSICPNGTVNIDWGDGSAVSTVTGTSLTTRKDTQHVYATAGKYTIKIHVASGSAAFCNTSSSPLLNANASVSGANRVYASCVKAVRIGEMFAVKQYAFSYCSSMESITIPSNVTSVESYEPIIDSYTFAYCYSLASITLPRGITKISNYAFTTCYSLTSIAIPSDANIASNVFNNCTSLASITLPSGVTELGTSIFNGCQTLESITLTSGITSIKNTAFQNCYSLASITIPSGVTSIGQNAFVSCFGVAEYHIKPTTPPTLGGNAFTNISSDCIMYVPSESLEAYQTATTWSTYASRMQGE